MISINLQIDENKVIRDIMKEIRRIIQNSLLTIKQKLSAEISQIVLRRLTQGVPVISGRDYHEIGIPDINDRIISVIRNVSNNIKVKVMIKPPDLLNIEIGILKADYSDLLSLPEAVFQYKSGGVLPWLRWLLLDGGGVIVNNYDYKNRPLKSSRTNFGFMAKGSGWSMPPNLVGTQNNNILTRALTNIDKDIELIVINVIKGNIK